MLTISDAQRGARWSRTWAQTATCEEIAEGTKDELATMINNLIEARTGHHNEVAIVKIFECLTGTYGENGNEGTENCPRVEELVYHENVQIRRLNFAIQYVVFEREAREFLIISHFHVSTRVRRI